jgi:hypothetical protein
MLNKNIVKIVIAVLIIAILYRILSAPNTPEQFDPYDPDFVLQANPTDPEPTPVVTGSPTQGDTITMPPMTTSVDLLPKPSSGVESEFGEFAPTKALEAQNFIDATKVIGVDTVGSSLRNASYDLRRSPTIPRTNIGPWQQSTTDADLYRKSLDC